MITCTPLVSGGMMEIIDAVRPHICSVDLHCTTYILVHVHPTLPPGYESEDPAHTPSTPDSVRLCPLCTSMGMYVRYK